jgi:hypothetical protein
MFCRAARLVAFGILLSLVAPRGAGAVDDAIRGFVSVEPFEFRLEALVRVAAFREVWRMEVDALGPVEQQAVLENLQTLFESGVNVKVPGAEPVYNERIVRFIVPDVEKGFIPDERDSIPLSEALVGLTFSATARGISEMELEWLWFAPGQERLVVEIASRGKPSARALTPTANKTVWKQSGETALPTLQDIPGLEIRETLPLRYLLYAGMAMVFSAGVVVVRRKTKSPAWVGWLIVGGVATVFLSLKVRVREVVVPAGAAIEDIVYALLRNTYHAFDFRDEALIYDTLEASVSGPLLEEVYLEMRESLELESTGGPRVRVYEIALRECKETGSGGLVQGQFRTRAEWVTIGEVTHWGHTHERTNRYEAEMTVSAAEDTWRISSLDLLNEERVQKISRREAAPES